MKPLVIYHGGCRDGWCAAWVVHHRYPDGEFYAGYYGSPPPDCTGRDVIIVDFSYPLAVMEGIRDVASTLLVLDHHKTAAEALQRMTETGFGARVVFDMERSGAGLAWDEFFPGQVRPWLVDYVEDRDLWRHKLPGSRVLNAWIGTLPFTFEAWTKAEQERDGSIERGEAVEAKVMQYVTEVRKNARRWTFEGHDVPLVNAPQVDISELLSAMCEGETFAMGWWQRADGVFQYSLRSRGDFDVSALAKLHGGGGHKNAAGFQSAVLL